MPPENIEHREATGITRIEIEGRSAQVLVEGEVADVAEGINRAKEGGVTLAGPYVRVHGSGMVPADSADAIYVPVGKVRLVTSDNDREYRRHRVGTDGPPEDPEPLSYEEESDVRDVGDGSF